MMSGNSTCPDCRSPRKPLAEPEKRIDGRCPTCGAVTDQAALSEFADRLARFGLGATRESIFTRAPELPDAK